MTVAPADACGLAGPKSGAHSGWRIFGGQSLELAAADVLEVAPRGRAGGLFIKKDRQMVPRGNFGGHFGRQRHAIGHRRALDRHERHDVDGAHARVLAGMLAKVDKRDSRMEQIEDSRAHLGGVTGEGAGRRGCAWRPA